MKKGIAEKTPSGLQKAGTWAAVGSCMAASAVMSAEPAQAQEAGTKPNILIIMSADVGITNVSAYGQGLVGYRTPNIDRIADEESEEG